MKKIKLFLLFLNLVKYNRIFICGIFFISCKSENENLNSFIKSAFPDLESGTIIVVPGTGCTTCLSEFETKIDSLIRIDTIRLLYTNIMSQKLLRHRIEERGIFNNNKIYIDSANEYSEVSKGYSKFWPYPTFFKIRNGQVSEISK